MLGAKMYTRIIARVMIPSYRVMKTKAQSSKSFSNFAASYTGIPSSVYKMSPTRRFYSEQTKSEENIADYDYVKRAVSNDDIVIVDVREPDEIKEYGKIPNSVNIPLGSVSTALSTMPENEFEQTYKIKKPNKNTEMIFYCMIGKRSAKAQQNAISAGYNNAKNYIGSWNDWASKQ